MPVKTMTVGQMKEALSKFDDDVFVAVRQYHECITDAGTDLGGDEAHGIDGIYDLERGYVVIQPAYDYLGSFGHAKFVKK